MWNPKVWTSEQIKIYGAVVAKKLTVAGDVQHLKMPGKQDELYVVRWLAGWLAYLLTGDVEDQGGGSLGDEANSEQSFCSLITAKLIVCF